jgi:hypothetical protein
MKLPEAPLVYKILFKCSHKHYEIYIEGSDLNTLFDGVQKFCKTFGTPPESIRLYDKNFHKILNFDVPFKTYDKSYVTVILYVD